MTLVRGEFVMREGEIMASPGYGRFVPAHVGIWIVREAFMRYRVCLSIRTAIALAHQSINEGREE